MPDRAMPDNGPVARIIVPRQTEAGGLPVRRVLPSVELASVGPFIFLDEFGPVTLDPGVTLDVRPHPHIGLSTLTWLFDGAVLHRDSLGVTQQIEPGEVNWMTAGRGIVHSERTPPELRNSGARLHGLQFWVALPDGFEEIEPSFTHHPAHELPAIDFGAIRMVLVAGEAFGRRAPVPVHSPLHLIEVQASPGDEIPLPLAHREQAVYVTDGEIEIGRNRVPAGRLVLLRESPTGSLTALTSARIVLIGGDPLGSERVVWWNFCARTPERLDAAKRDWANDAFPGIPGETERMPLPLD
jgi:redox-sensitive bicupin YhaK (pirin superfamily)